MGEKMPRRKGQTNTPKEDIDLVKACIKYKKQKQQTILECYSIIAECREDIKKLSPARIAEKLELGKKIVDRIHTEEGFSCLGQQRI